MGILDWLFGKSRPAHTGYGWCPDEPDFRDYNHGIEFWSGINRGRADLRPFMPPIVDQGSIGSCVACALSAMVSYLAFKEISEDRARRGTLIPLDDIEKQYTDEPYFFGDDGEIHIVKKQLRSELETVSATSSTANNIIFSSLFLYYEGRLAEETQESDAGMSLRSGLKILAKKGICREEYWPYVTSRYLWKPSKAAYNDAQAFRIKKYWRLYSLGDMKDALDQGYPVAMGMMLYDNFHDLKLSFGTLDIPAKDAKKVGGHCVLAVGYDDDTGHIICRNSMGPFWGDHGYFKMPYRYFSTKGLIQDIWTIR